MPAPPGWLTVAGLGWLKPGANTFGAGGANDIVLPADTAPPRAGAFVLVKGHVRVEVREGVAVTLGGKAVTRMDLRSDAGGAAPDVLSLGALTLQIIDRGGRLGVRVKDMKSAARAKFKGLHYFPIDPRYRVVATFVPNAKPVSINVPNVLGMVETPKTDDEVRSIAYVAREAAIRLEMVTDELRGLFGACVAEF